MTTDNFYFRSETAGRGLGGEEGGTGESEVASVRE